MHALTIGLNGRPYVLIFQKMGETRGATDCVMTSYGPTADHPDFSESYLEFRELYDLGEAGVFTLTFPEIVDLVEKATASTET